MHSKYVISLVPNWEPIHAKIQSRAQPDSFQYQFRCEAIVLLKRDPRVGLSKDSFVKEMARRLGVSTGKISTPLSNAYGPKEGWLRCVDERGNSLAGWQGNEKNELVPVLPFTPVDPSGKPVQTRPAPPRPPKKMPLTRYTMTDYAGMGQREDWRAATLETLEDLVSRMHDLLYERGLEFCAGDQWYYSLNRWPHAKIDLGATVGATPSSTPTQTVSLDIRLRGRDREKLLLGPQCTALEKKVMLTYRSYVEELNNRNGM